MRSASCALGIALVWGLALAGCAGVKHTFEDQDAEHVWKAMVAVAEQPRYDDWTIVANDVWVDEADHRIEIHRRLDRHLHVPGAKPRREERTWQIEVRLLGTDPPRAKFASRNANVPTQLQAEASRYFDDVLDLLSGLPGESAFESRDRELLDSLGLDEEGDADPSDG
jgi:hypothetical protein